MGAGLSSAPGVRGPLAFRPSNFAAGARSPKLSPLPTETQFGEIVAWKAWQVTHFPRTNEKLLTSLYRGTVWHPQEKSPEAEGADETTENEWNKIPAKENEGCKLKDYGPTGFYSYKTLQGLLNQEFYHSMIIGKVLLWGEVIEHELGYRSQYCRILELKYMNLEDNMSLEDKMGLFSTKQRGGEVKKFCDMYDDKNHRYHSCNEGHKESDR